MAAENSRSGGGGPAAPAWWRFDPPLMLQGGELDRFLGSAFPGRRAGAVEFLERGVVNTNYRIDLLPAGGGAAGPDRLRLRLSRSGDGPLREGAIAGALGDSLGVALPRLLATEWADAPEPHRRSFFSWIEGIPLDDWLRRATPGECDVATGLGRALAALHRTAGPAFGRIGPDLAPVTAPDRPAATRWVDELGRRLAPRFDNPAHGLDRAALTVLRGAFERASAPLQAELEILPALVHGDLSPGNLLVCPGTGRAAGLAGWLDWEMSRLADPALDLASLRFEIGEAAPWFAADVEEAYRLAAGPARLAGWERRVDLAGLPMLLDARMVAHRRRSAAQTARIDRRLAAFTRRWGEAGAPELS